METNIRAPQQLLRTRVYEEGVIEEATYLLGDYLSTRSIMGSIAFPEVVTPIVVTLRRALKTGKTSSGSAKSKEIGMVKGLVERVEESAKAIEKQRLNVRFGPGDTKEVDEWEATLNIEETPLGKYMKVQKKAREKRRKLVEKVSLGLDCCRDYGVINLRLSRRETERRRCWKTNHNLPGIPHYS
jgi:nucleolar complex protein 2